MKRILVAPLNWGLGHATRCIPIIDAILARGHHVALASDGRAGALLQREYPDCPYHHLPSYAIRYPQRMPYLYWIQQLPRLREVIRSEHQALHDILSTHHYDGIVSDNRYGMYSNEIPSAIVSHQLTLPLGIFSRLSSPLLARHINKFSECWVPDLAQAQRITAKLSQNRLVRTPLMFIGHLSRFQPKDPVEEDLLCTAIISGPEPDRTRFERIVRSQFAELPGPTCLVAGRTEHESDVATIGQLTSYASLTTTEMGQLLRRSKFVLCRAGYSSIMDLLALGKKAILVPTPHQPEQIYLAKRLKANPSFLIQEEQNLDLFQALEMVSGPATDPASSTALEDTLTTFLERM